MARNQIQNIIRMDPVFSSFFFACLPFAAACAVNVRIAIYLLPLFFVYIDYELCYVMWVGG